MTDRLTPLCSIEGLDAALRESFDRPILILKHSRTCGISAQAIDDIYAWLGKVAAVGTSYIVTVQTDRHVANAITDRLGIRHESPQALVLRDGSVAWHASHFRVTASAIERELTKAA